jgi:hypothetical protein
VDTDTPTGDAAREILEFALHHDINRNEAAALTTPGAHSVEAQRGLWQNILLNLRNYQEGDPEPVQHGEIPIAEIHVPAVEGCECKYVMRAGSAKKVGLTARIRGVAGGAGREAKVLFSNTLSSPRCGQVTIPGSYPVTPWFNPDTRSRIDLVKFMEFRPESLGLRDIPPYRAHPCAPGVADELAALEHTPGAVYATHRIDIPKSRVTPSQSVEHTRELTLTLDGLLEVKSQFTKGFSYEWTIVGAANYLRYFEDGRSHAHFWRWDMLG